MAAGDPSDYPINGHVDTRADTTVHVFRVDEALRRQAMAICEQQHIDLNDVLRALIRRIAKEGALPFHLDAPARSETDQHVPFDDYGDFLKHDLAHLEVEALISVLARLVADRARRIAAEQRKRSPARTNIRRWEGEIAAAMQIRRGKVDLANRALVDQLQQRFGALLAAESDHGAK